MPKLVAVLLVLAVGYFLWRFFGDYANNIYFQSSPITEILGDFWLLANLFLIIGLTLTLVVTKPRRRIP